MSTRNAAVAGFFYEADASRLQDHVNQLLDAASDESEPVPEILIVPHAGYVYSGSTAACAYRRLRKHPDRVRRILLMGPAHRVYVAGMAIPSVDSFTTPLGEVALDRGGLERIAAMPGVEISDEAHREEHSLEVQLPFLQTVLNDFMLMPVVVGGADAAIVAAVIDAFAGDSCTLIVISSDLSHFKSYAEAQRFDADTCARILGKATDLVGEQACGARAINGLMASQRGQTLEVSLLQTCNSGDTAGSRDRVVGYGAFALY